jgi:hypothetical protein
MYPKQICDDEIQRKIYLFELCRGAGLTGGTVDVHQLKGMWWPITGQTEQQQKIKTLRCIFTDIKNAPKEKLIKLFFLCKSDLQKIDLSNNSRRLNLLEMQ